MINNIWKRIKSLTIKPKSTIVKRHKPKDYINPQEIIKNYSVENLCEKAEDYFQKIDDPLPFITRPFSNFDKSPQAIISLGLLMSGLHLGKTMKVLDFGAGVCWVSRLLNQMSVSTISVDCSPTALEQGKKLFKEHPIIGEYIEEPQFLVYDGHTIDLPDAVVDRIICFDSFHHVPNVEQILSQFSRVLKEGGIVGFAEPGVYHSYSPQSQSEMKNYGVLENDINLDYIWPIAQKLGFTKLYFKLAGNTTISHDEYKEIINNDSISSNIRDSIIKANEQQTIFFLQKGMFSLDSRMGTDLFANISIANKTDNIKCTANENIKLTLSITNTGGAKWLHENKNNHGVVMVGGHLYNAEKQLLNLNYFRAYLPNEILPGQTIELPASFNAPETKGRYIVALDMVAEQICWFENKGSIMLLQNIIVE